MVARILSLLENPAHIRGVTECLEQSGHRVDVVDSFAKATVMLQAQSFDLIISDVHLENGGSIFDFLKWVRSRQHFQAIPFVLFSLEPSTLAKYLADGVRTAARQLGATRYISMEIFDPGILTEEISDLLAGVPAVQIHTEEGE